MQTITCPSCGTTSEFARLNWSSDEFCTRCDFPLFWAPGAYEASVTAPLDEGPVVVPAAVALLTALICPACTRANPEDATYCNACATVLNPAAVPAPEPPPVVPFDDTWLRTLLATCVGIAAVLTVVLGFILW